MRTSLILSIGAAAALALAGCANHTPTVVTKQKPASAGTLNAEQLQDLDAIKAKYSTDVTSYTNYGWLAADMVGAPAGAIVEQTVGRVVYEIRSPAPGWCERYAGLNDVSVSACAAPRVVLEVLPCVRSVCPHSTGAIAVVVPAKDAPKLGEIVTVLRAPGATTARVLDDGYTARKYADLW